MAFQPSDTLKSRTFIGLILAQFLAAFNDQAIHASAMFYAIIHKVDGTHGILTQAQAISLMPILFYAPWAIFCTLAGYLADRFSKRSSLVAWKLAEVGITLVALAGFWMGSQHNPLGPWVVMATVFLMGTHSAFFVPAKYGAMPEILTPQQLSKGNGVLESTSFLAVILGTVSGGVLSFFFIKDQQEYFIGLILVGLAVVGAAASLLIRPMPAANPQRPYPRNPVKPLVENLKVLLKSRPLALAVLGIAFFTFMVAFMRGTVYMHGETQHPRWDEFRTSLVVATVALGVGLGSPLAGVFSGGKVELGLVPFGAVGMIVGTLLAALYLAWVPGLIAALVVIGFFSGFYIVPLYTLLQHRAPKTSKGDLIATSNFINVTGAIVASLLFYGLIGAARWVGVVTPITQTGDVAQGQLWDVKKHHGRPVYFEVRQSADAPPLFTAGQRPEVHPDEDFLPRLARMVSGSNGATGIEIKIDETLHNGDAVEVSEYTLRGVKNYEVRRAGTPLENAYDQQDIPRYLFIGASGLTLAILLLLCRQLPDFFVRSLLWLRSHGRTRVKVIGVNNLPSNGPVILATNCDRFQECMLVLAATDRFTRFVLLESAADSGPRRPLLRFLARRTGLVELRAETLEAVRWEKALGSANRTLNRGDLLGLTVDSAELVRPAEAFLTELLRRKPTTLLPVFCGPADPTDGGLFGVRRFRVVIGHPLPPETSVAEVREAIRALGEWVQQAERDGTPPTVMIPGAPATAAGRSPH